MNYVLIRHKVADFAKWKHQYDAHRETRQKAGLAEKQLFRNMENPGEVIILFEAADLQKAHAFVHSDDLRDVMTKAGVSDRPDIFFLH